MSRTIPDSLVLFCMFARSQKSLKLVRLGTAAPHASEPLPPPRQSMILRSGLTVVSVIRAYGCAAVRAESSQATPIVGLSCQPQRQNDRAARQSFGFVFASTSAPENLQGGKDGTLSLN